MQFFGQYYEIRDNEVNDFNRPTQALIDNSSYITGPYTPFADGSLLGLVTPTGTKKIYGYQSLNGPADSARGNKLSLQLITTLNLVPDWKIVNYQFYEHLESRKSVVGRRPQPKSMPGPRILPQPEADQRQQNDG
jgi:hypothetical protein